jgi:hypothetical protein
LVVEGWIGDDGIRVAAAEFEQHGYEYIVATSAPSDKGSVQSPSTYAEIELFSPLPGTPKGDIPISLP